MNVMGFFAFRDDYMLSLNRDFHYSGPLMLPLHKLFTQKIEFDAE